jgi:hypothetical protein
MYDVRCEEEPQRQGGTEKHRQFLNIIPGGLGDPLRPPKAVSVQRSFSEVGLRETYAIRF